MMPKLLYAEYQKMRRLNMVWLMVFATIMIAILIFAGGQGAYYDARYIDYPGWYMTAGQAWSTFFVLPAVIALLGSYMICREEREGTMMALCIIPINEAKLTAAKMIVAATFSELIYLLLFVITFLVEAILHLSDLSTEMIWGFLKSYLLDGIGIFVAISPLIALVARIKKGYWLALIFTEIYSFMGLFAAMSRMTRMLYPITAALNISGFYHVETDRVLPSYISLLFCGCFATLILIGMNKKTNGNT